MNKECICKDCGKCASVPGGKNGAIVKEHPQQWLIVMLEEICGSDNVVIDPVRLNEYGKDHTLNLQYEFDSLVKPGSSLEISAILKLCNQYKIPVTPRGGGSGVTGGALPVMGGIVLSLERLNKIISINN